MKKKKKPAECQGCKARMPLTMDTASRVITIYECFNCGRFELHVVTKAKT